MFILANGLHMQKHFTFHWDALQDYRDGSKLLTHFPCAGGGRQNHGLRTLRGPYSFKLVRQPEAC